MDPWVRLLSQGGRGKGALRDFLGGLSGAHGLKGLIWIPARGPEVFGPGVAQRDWWDCRGQDLQAGELRWTPYDLCPGLNPGWS